MSSRRRIQILFLGADIVSSLMVWLCFLLFRWLVWEGRAFGMEGVVIPAFDFYKPLVFYPLGCVLVYYLSGFYLKPFHKKYFQVFITTFASAMVISVVAFFVIVVDDVVEDYHRYFTALAVLMGLQWSISYFIRWAMTWWVNRRFSSWRCYTIHSVEEAGTFMKANARKRYDEVVIDLEIPYEEKDIYAIINRIYPSGVDIAIMPRLYDMLTGAARISEVVDIPKVRITDHHMSDSELCVKRAFDVVFAMVSLVVLSPLYGLIALAVKCSSKGPIIYGQERIGLYGLPFVIYKFRTMQDHAEEGEPQLSSDDDPRITKVGRVLRRYRLDELPQMWNVLRGDMSVVGPRPERRFFIRQIEEYAPYYCLLYKIRPGLTSWGPVKVGYTDTMDKMVRRLNYDIVYMENMSIRLDIKILFYTIGVIIDGKGK